MYQRKGDIRFQILIACLSLVLSGAAAIEEPIRIGIHAHSLHIHVRFLMHPGITSNQDYRRVQFWSIVIQTRSKSRRMQVLVIDFPANKSFARFLRVCCDRQVRFWMDLALTIAGRAYVGCPFSLCQGRTQSKISYFDCAQGERISQLHLARDLLL